MVNIEPLKQYLEGLEAYRQGNNELALELIAKSIGAQEATPLMKEALAQIAKPNQAILALILHRSKE